MDAAITFDDVTGIAPGDDGAYARVLIGLWQAPGAWQDDDDAQAMCRFLEERRVPDAAAQWVYDNLPHTDAHRAVLSHPGLGEERVNDAARIVTSAIEAGRSRSDPRMALSKAFDNPALTREAIDAAIRVASLLPSFVVGAMLRGGALTGRDVQVLWEARGGDRSNDGGWFVDLAVRGGSAPDNLVDEWLNDGRYAHYAAAYATGVSEETVLRVAHNGWNALAARALMNPVLSGEVLWSEMRRLRSEGGDWVHYVLANKSARPAMLEAGARDGRCESGWVGIAGNPVATRGAFETLLFTGSNDKLRLLQEAGRNPGFPPALVWDVYRVFGAGPALNFMGAPSDLVRDVAGFYADRRFSRGYSTGMNVLFHRNCPADVRSRLAWDDRSLWPLVADDAYRGRHVKKAGAPDGADVDVSSLYPLCG